MAKFPIYEAQGSLPGVGGAVEGSLDVPYDPTGRAVQQAGGALAQMGHGMFRAQGIAELAEAQAKNRETWTKIETELLKETDPEKYQGIYEKYLPEMEGREVKNGWAARRYRQEMALSKPKWQGLITEAAHKRALENAKWAEINAQSQAIETGSMTGYEFVMNNLVDAGLMSPEQRDAEVHATKRLVDLRRMERLAYTSPEQVLSWKTVADMQADVPGAMPPDLQYIRGLARSQMAFRQNEAGAQRQQYTEKLWDFTNTPGRTSREILEYIDKLPDELFPPDEKDRLFKSEMSRQNIISKGKGDPRLVRQDHDLYWDMLKRAEDEDLTISEARQAVDDNKIAIVDYQHLKNIINGDSGARANAYSMTSVVRTLEELIDDRWPTQMYPTVSRESIKVKARRQLEDAIKQAQERGQPLEGRALEDEMLRIFDRLEKPTSGITEYVGVGPKGAEYVSWILTEEERDALPSGTIYKWRDGTVRRKR